MGVPSVCVDPKDFTVDSSGRLQIKPAPIAIAQGIVGFDTGVLPGTGAVAPTPFAVILANPTGRVMRVTAFMEIQARCEGDAGTITVQPSLSASIDGGIQTPAILSGGISFIGTPGLGARMGIDFCASKSMSTTAPANGSSVWVFYPAITFVNAVNGRALGHFFCRLEGNLL